MGGTADARAGAEAAGQERGTRLKIAEVAVDAVIMAPDFIDARVRSNGALAEADLAVIKRTKAAAWS